MQHTLGGFPLPDNHSQLPTGLPGSPAASRTKDNTADTCRHLVPHLPDARRGAVPAAPLTELARSRNRKSKTPGRTYGVPRGNEKLSSNFFRPRKRWRLRRHPPPPCCPVPSLSGAGSRVSRRRVLRRCVLLFSSRFLPCPCSHGIRRR